MSLNFAHRGWSGLYPENTLLAFQKAIELGVDGFEMDVQLSRDGEVVVFHDETLDRVTGYHGYLRDLTVSELKRLDASSGFRGLYGKNEIPTLREFLELVAPTELIVNMELKNNRQYYPRLEEKVIALVRAFGMEKRVIFSSFNNVSILRCRRLAPEIDAGFLWKGPVIGQAGQYCRSINTVIIYDVDKETGVLTPLFHCKTSGDYPKAVAVMPDNKHFIVLSHETDEIFIYNMNYEDCYFLQDSRPIKIEQPNCIFIHKL